MTSTIDTPLKYALNYNISIESILKYTEAIQKYEKYYAIPSSRKLDLSPHLNQLVATCGDWRQGWTDKIQRHLKTFFGKNICFN